MRSGGGFPVHSVPVSAGVHGEGYHESSASELAELTGSGGRGDARLEGRLGGGRKKQFSNTLVLRTAAYWS